MNLDSVELTFDCPKCGKRIKEKAGRLKRHKNPVCPACGTLFDGDKFRAALADKLKKPAGGTWKVTNG